MLDPRGLILLIANFKNASNFNTPFNTVEEVKVSTDPLEATWTWRDIGISVIATFMSERVKYAIACYHFSKLIFPFLKISKRISWKCVSYKLKQTAPNGKWRYLFLISPQNCFYFRARLSFSEQLPLAHEKDCCNIKEKKKRAGLPPIYKKSIPKCQGIFPELFVTLK